MRKYDKIKRIQRIKKGEIMEGDSGSIIIQEKYDGANGRCYIDENGDMEFGSRNQILKIDDKDAKRFRPAFNYIKENMTDELVNKYKKCTIYFEIMVKHTLNYNWDKMPCLIILDVFDEKEGKFIHHKHLYDFNRAGFHVARIIAEGKDNVQSKIKEALDGKFVKSEFADFSVEGYVIKNYDKQLFTKVVRKEFEEVLMGKRKNKNESEYRGDEDAIVNKYVTPARVRKVAYKLVDKGEELSIKLMRYLAKDILQDISDECEEDWLFSDCIVNFPLLRKKISKRTAKELNKIIEEKNGW